MEHDPSTDPALTLHYARVRRVFLIILSFIHPPISLSICT